MTSFVGRNPAAVAALEQLCAELAIGVLESVPNYVNYPATEPLYLGCQWNERQQNAALAEADFIVVIDSDVPWIPAVSRPRPEARIVHIDPDPLKTRMPLWYIPAEASYRADAATALGQILEAARDLPRATAKPASPSAARSFARRHEAWQRSLAEDERPRGDRITPEHLTAAVREAVGEDAVVLSETVTNFHVVTRHMRRTRPGTLFTSGGGSLGWSGGAAIGAKLARPDALVVALSGDGSYLFSQPATVHWMARRYATPFLQVIYNNGGWRAPRAGALGIAPRRRREPRRRSRHGVRARSRLRRHRRRRRRRVREDDLAARGGRAGPGGALEAVRNEGRCAVIDARIAQPSPRIDARGHVARPALRRRA